MTAGPHVAGKVGEIFAALAVARRDVIPARAKRGIPILNAVLIVAEDGHMSITGNCLDACATGFAAVTVVSPGATAVPAERLYCLLETVPEDAEIELKQTSETVVVRLGNSQWRLPALPPNDFPPPLSPQGPCAQFRVSRDDIWALCGLALTAAMSEDPTRLHLCGVFLHESEGFLTSAATDGLGLFCQRTAVPAGDQLPPNGTAHGVVLPPRARAEMLALVKGKDGIDLAISRSLIEARTEDAIYVSKLLDVTFPDYRRLVPPRHAAAIEIDTGPLLSALARLVAVSGSIVPPVAGLSWDEAGAIRIELPHEPDSAVDTVPGVARGSAQLAVQAAKLADLVNALNAKTVQLSASQPVLLEPAGGDGTALALLATTAWARPQVRRAA
jgi:DNA polymerase-3 subunit beta